MFIILKLNIASAIREFRYDIPASDVIIRRWRTPTDYENVNDLLLSSDTYRYTELLKGDEIGKIPTYMEETHVLLHTPINNNSL